MMKDYQRQRVYDWEDDVVRSRCSNIVRFENGQQYVDGVWLANGWTRPPKVFPHRSKKVIASAHHGVVNLPDKVAAWVILHELAHALTDDQHGPNFVGVYLTLLERVERLPKLMLMYSLEQAKIDYALGAQPLRWVVHRS